MTEKSIVSKKGFSADWLLRGSLTKIGDTFDRFTGRRWVPSSSLATSELIERIKTLLDAEAKQIPGKGVVVPHNIKLKMQWDKFSTDAEDALQKLEYELLAATADHINDSLYYTYAPISLEVKPDYFIEGVKLMVSFDKFADENRDVEMNVTIPAIKVADVVADLTAKRAEARETYVARFEVKGLNKEKTLEFPRSGRISVGRTGSNNLVIDDASVSKIHGALSVDENGGLSVADTGSTNGTFLNDQRISYGKATRLMAGDRVKFGTVDVTFEYVPRPVVVESDAAENVPDGEIVKIDGFEFTRRNSENEVVSLAAIPMPEDTLKVNSETGRETVPHDPATNVETAGEISHDEMKTETDVDL